VANSNNVISQQNISAAIKAQNQKSAVKTQNENNPHYHNIIKRLQKLQNNKLVKIHYFNTCANTTFQKYVSKL